MVFDAFRQNGSSFKPVFRYLNIFSEGLQMHFYLLQWGHVYT